MIERRIINPWSWQDKYGFVQANEISGASKTLICSGQAAINAEGKVAYPDDIDAQLKMALDNLEEVLQKADFSLSDIVRLTIRQT
jgi:enamine deaminase RidA (YjgF/YER057c/UK114 family)